MKIIIQFGSRVNLVPMGAEGYFLFSALGAIIPLNKHFPKFTLEAVCSPEINYSFLLRA
jgi:hypothetical protein